MSKGYPMIQIASYQYIFKTSFFRHAQKKLKSLISRKSNIPLTSYGPKRLFQWSIRVCGIISFCQQNKIQNRTYSPISLIIQWIRKTPLAH